MKIVNTFIINEVTNLSDIFMIIKNSHDSFSVIHIVNEIPNFIYEMFLIALIFLIAVKVFLNLFGSVFIEGISGGIFIYICELLKIKLHTINFAHFVGGGEAFFDTFGASSGILLCFKGAVINVRAVLILAASGIGRTIKRNLYYPFLSIKINNTALRFATIKMKSVITSKVITFCICPVVKTKLIIMVFSTGISSFFVAKSCIKTMSKKLIHYIGSPFNISNSRFHLNSSFLTLYIYYIKNFKENQI